MEGLDMRAAAFRADPYAVLRPLREAGPLCRVEPFGFLGVTRYDDVLAVLKNPKTFSSTSLDRAFPEIEGAELFTRRSTLIGNDPPDHTRIRRLIQRAFTLQEMAAWEPKVAALTQTLVERLRGKAAFDLIADLAMPLPVTVIAEMLGVDPTRGPDFKRWSDDMVSVRTAHASADAAWRERREREIVRSCQEFTAYFEAVIEERRRVPDGRDLISAMIRAADDAQIIKADEVLSLTRLMLVAGNETTTNLLGNAVTALLRNPEEWQRLVRNPALAAGATEEALRGRYACQHDRDDVDAHLIEAVPNLHGRDAGAFAGLLECRDMARDRRKYRGRSTEAEIKRCRRTAVWRLRLR